MISFYFLSWRTFCCCPLSGASRWWQTTDVRAEREINMNRTFAAGWTGTSQTLEIMEEYESDLTCSALNHLSWWKLKGKESHSNGEKKEIKVIVIVLMGLYILICNSYSFWGISFDSLFPFPPSILKLPNAFLDSFLFHSHHLQSVYILHSYTINCTAINPFR